MLAHIFAFFFVSIMPFMKYIPSLHDVLFNTFSGSGESKKKRERNPHKYTDGTEHHTLLHLSNI